MTIYKINGFNVLEYVDKLGAVFIIFKGIWPVFKCYGYGDALDYCKYPN